MRLKDPASCSFASFNGDLKELTFAKRVPLDKNYSTIKTPLARLFPRLGKSFDTKGVS